MGNQAGKEYSPREIRKAKEVLDGSCQVVIRAASNGKPRFDNVEHIHETAWKMLSDDEKEEVKKCREHGHTSLNCCEGEH